MTTRNILLAALGGAAAAAIVTNYLGSEKGKQLLSSASDALKDLTSKATDFAKNNLPSLTSGREEQPYDSKGGVQPS